MNDKSHVFEQTYQHYLKQISEIELEPLSAILGGKYSNGCLHVPLLDKTYCISKSGITRESGKKAPFPICIVLSKYILMCPESVPENTQWKAFRDFKDSGPLIVFFANDVEGSISRRFAENTTQLRNASEAMGGKPPNMDLSYDFSARFQALPRVGMLLLFNDRDNAFPAQCSVLFESRAESFLDMESVAILGHIFAEALSNVSINE